MTPTEQSARRPSHEMGLFATLGASVFATGICAPKLGRSGRVALPALLALFAALTLNSSPAQAAQTRNLLRTFGCPTTAENCGVPAPTGATLSNPQGDAIDQSSGDVYVADTANNRVEKFGPNGEFILAFGKNVNKTKVETLGTTEAERDVCDPVTELAVVCQPGSKSSTPGAFENAQFVEVDPTASHDVYVADTADNIVSKFSSEGVLEELWGTEGQLNGSTTPATMFGEIAGIAVNAAGELYVLSMSGEVFEFDAGGAFKTGVPTERETRPYGLGVDAAGNLFKAIGAESVAKFNASGGEIGEVTGEIRPRALAFAPGAGGEASGDLYAPTEGRTLEHYAFNGTGGVIESDSTAVGFIASGIGVAASGDTFLSNAEEGNVYQFGPLVTDPAVVTGSPSENKIGAHTAILEGTVNPEGQPLTGCAFEYVEASKYKPHAADPYAGGATAACEEPDATEVGEGTKPVPVHAEAKGLNPNTKYDYRLTAANHEGQSQGANVEFSTQPPPSVDSATVTALTATSATLNAQINPNGLATSYRFEYLTETQYNENDKTFIDAEVASGTIPSGTSDVFVSAPIDELKAHEHTYYWRVVATNESGTTASVQHSFVYATQSAGLPDGRAYEMVSPDRKNGSLLGDVSGLGIPTDVAADGQRVITSVIQCFAGAAGCNAQQDDGIGSPYEFTRTSGGWVTTALSPPASPLTPNVAFGYSAQAGTALFGVPTGPSDEDDLYVREPSGKFVDVGPDTPPEDGEQGPHGGVRDAREQAHTSDFSRFAWDANYLWSPPFVEDGTHINEAFEVAPGKEGKSRHFNVGVTGGYEEEGGSPNLISGCGTNLGQAHANGAAPPGTMSADGQSVYFTALPERSGASCRSGAQEVPVAEVFARVDGETAGAHTVAISEPSPSACGSGAGAAEVACRTAPAASAEFIAGSEDGSDALFASTQQLTDGATEDPNPGDSAAIDSATPNGCEGTTAANGCSLYLFEGVTAEHGSERRLVDVSEGEGVVAGGPRVQGVLAVSPSSAGERVYFVAKGVLTGSERPGCMAEWVATGRGGEAVCHAVEGAENLYVYSQETHRLGFVAAMSASDSSEWAEEEAGLPANVTPDGRFLVFVSRGDLTVDDTSRSGAYQVFRYDAVTGGLLRLSVGAGGFNDDGNRSSASACTSTVGLVCSEDANVVRAKGASRRDPSMSDSGSRVFFESPVGLTPHALDDVQISDTSELLGYSQNMPVYAENVYEWESGGVGSCPAGRVSGCVFLISDGRDVGVTRGQGPGCSAGSAVCLLGSDASGDNVFIATTDALVASDTNTELDYYDARVCEAASPCVEASASVVGCAGEECHGLPSGSPGVPSVPSASFSGSGNVTPPPVVKPVVLTRAEKFTKALKACHAKANKHKRVACEAVARKRYGPPHKAKRAAKAKRSASRRGGR